MRKHINRKKYLKYEEKYVALKHYFEDGLTVEEVSGELGVDLSTVYKWLIHIDYDFRGIEKLKRKIVTRESCRGKIPVGLEDWVKEEILSLLKKHPGLGALKLKQYFFRHYQVLLSEKKIYYFLKDSGIIEKRLKERGGCKKAMKHDRRFEYPEPLAGVQLDLLELKLSGGQKLSLVTLIDDHSRFILGSRFIPAKSMTSVIKILGETIREHGVMECILTDKGSEFVSWHSFTDFEGFLCAFDIELITSGPEKPQGIGKIERWHGTFRSEFEQVHGGFEYSSQAQFELNKFLNYYNYERPHQALNGLVPADRYFGVSAELETELEKYKSGENRDRQIYFCCNINGKKLVVSGTRGGTVEMYENNIPLKDAKKN